MRPTNTPEELRKAYRAIAALVTVVLVVGATTVAIRAAYGAFSDDMVVRVTFARAGQALHPGTDVKYRGVNVGRVRSVELVDRQVEVALQIGRDRQIPADTTARVRSKTLFGEKYVELAVRPADRGPFLADGDEVDAAGPGTEVEELVDGADALLEAIDVDELAVLMTELTEVAQGRGDDFAHLIDRSVEASTVFADTIDAQEDAIASLARFTEQYRDVGPQINAISTNLNELLPTFNAARADYERLLVTLRPFADHLADFVDINEADLGALLDDGANIVRVLTARKENIAASLRGLADYTYNLSNAISPEALPDGSRFGYLKLFIEAGDLGALLCATLGPTGPGAQLGPVLDVLSQAVPELGCDGGGGAVAADGGGGSGGTPTTPPDAAPSTVDAADGSGVAEPSAGLTELIAAEIGRVDPTGGGGSALGAVLGPLLGER